MESVLRRYTFLYTSPDGNLTAISLALATTWKLVTMIPSGLIMNPLAKPSYDHHRRSSMSNDFSPLSRPILGCDLWARNWTFARWF